MHPSQTLLDEHQAAARLGITTQLLLAYTRNKPKQHLGDTNTLKITRREGRCLFRLEDLDEWNRYLRAPWSSSGDDRPAIPTYVARYLDVECGGQCALCGKGHKLNSAHISPYVTSRSHHHHNLIRLCTDCHSKFDDGLIPLEEVQRVKDALIQRVREIAAGPACVFSRKEVYRVPQPAPLFEGRRAELAVLAERLSDQRLVIVEGVGGIGKTQLVLRALQQLDDNLPTLWLDVESYASFEDLRLALLTSLLRAGIPIHGESFFDALAQQPLRIVLDGLDRMPQAEWDQVIDFLKDLIELTERPKVVVTTQIEISYPAAAACKLNLLPLTPADSDQLLHSSCAGARGLSIEEEHIGWLASFCEGHALSLNITAGLLHYYKQSEAVVERLKAFGAPELRDPVRQGQRRSTSLEACLLAAYSCFSAGQKRLLRYVSNFPAGCMEMQAARWSGAGDYHPLLAELRRFFFVEVRPDGWFAVNRLHTLNPVRQFVLSRWAAEDPEDAAATRLEVAGELAAEASMLNLEYFERGAEAEELKYGLLRVEVELPNFINALRFAEGMLVEAESAGGGDGECLEIVSSMSFALSKYLFVRGLLTEGASFVESGAVAAEKLGKVRLAATQYMMLANMQARMHDYRGHELTVGKAFILARRTGDPRIGAMAAMGAGDLAKIHGRYAEAARHYDAAASYFRRALQDMAVGYSGDDDTRYYTGMLGLTLASLGEVYWRMRRPGEALPYLLEALDYVSQIEDHTNLGAVYHELGNCYAELGDVTKAVAAYKEALGSFYQLGYRQYISNAMGEMGKTIAEEGYFPEWLEASLPEDMLSEGLEDVRQDIELLLDRWDRPVEDDVKLLGKVFGIVKLISFTTKAGMLKDWAKRLGDEVVAPLLAADFDDPDRQHESFRRILQYITSLAFYIGEISVGDEQYTEEQVFRLCLVCDLLNCWPASKPFEWLAALLRHRKIYPETTGRQLHDAIRRAIETEDRAAFKIAVR
jgi:tetratricopeptide (TPR) repeat protein